MGYQAVRLEAFQREKSVVDEIIPPARYPMRGLKEGDSYEYGALTWEEIHALDTEFLRYSLDLYMNFRTFGALPHGGGWLSERRTVVDILKVLSSEENAFDAWEREKAMRSVKKK